MDTKKIKDTRRQATRDGDLETIAVCDIALGFDSDAMHSLTARQRQRVSSMTKEDAIARLSAMMKGSA